MKIKLNCETVINFLVKSYKERLDDNGGKIAEELRDNIRIPKIGRPLYVKFDDNQDSIVVEASEQYLDEIANDLPTGTSLFREFKDAIQEAKE